MVLNSFDKEMKRRSSTQEELTTTIIGQVLFIFILVMLFTSYLSLFRKDYFDQMYEAAVKLIKKGKAYVSDLSGYKLDILI